MRRTRIATLLTSLLLGTSAFAQTPAYFSLTSNACNSYTGLVRSYGVTHYWRFLETSGTSAADSVGTNTGTYQSSPTLSAAGPLITPSKGIILNGSSQHVTTTTLYSNPTTFTLLIWFKTTTTSGGKLIGLGGNQTGTSSNYDRQIYMTNSGNIVFGVNPGSLTTLTTPAAYNDGQWHMAVATLSSVGMTLSVDANTMQFNSNTGAQNFNGYWRIGFDNVTGWPSTPTSAYFAGTLSEAAVFSGVALTDTQIKELYMMGGSCSNYNAPPPTLAFAVGSQTVNDNNCSAATSVSTNTLSTTPITVNLSASNTTFYSDQYCTQPITSVTIPSMNTNSSSFYFITSTVGTSTLTASATSFTSATQTETINSNPYRWTGSGTDSNWSTAANWSGGAAPGSSNTALFDGVCVTNCSPTISSSINVGGVRINTGYSGTITQSSGAAITMVSKGWVQSAGTFAGSAGSDAITISGPLYVQGGSFQSTSATLTLRNNFIVSGSGSFAHHSGTVLLEPPFSNSATFSIGTNPLNNLTLASEAGYDGYTLSTSGTVNIGGNLSMNSPTGTAIPVINGGTLAVSGNVTVSGAHRFDGNTLIKMVNSNNATLTGGGTSFQMLAVEIASTGGTTTIAGTPYFSQGFTYTSGTVVVSATDVYFGFPYPVTGTINTGSIQFNNVHFYAMSGFDGWTMNLTNNVTVLGNLYLDHPSGVVTPTLNGSSILVSGNITSTGSYEMRGTTQINAVGSSNQTISCASGTSLPSINIASTGGTVTLSGSMTLRRNFTYTSGTVDASGSSITFDPEWGTGNYTISPGSIAFNNVTFNSQNSFDGYTLTLSAPLTVNGTLTLSQNGGSTATLNGSYIIANGNVVSSGSTYFAGTTTLTIAGSTNTTITTSTSNNSLLKTNLTINKTGGATVTLASALSLPNAGQTMTISSGTMNMAGYTLGVNSTLTISSGATLTKSGGTLTYGSLSNSGTLNP